MTNEYKILNNIKNANDIKQLSIDELNVLATLAWYSPGAIIAVPSVGILVQVHELTKPPPIPNLVVNADWAVIVGGTCGIDTLPYIVAEFLVSGHSCTDPEFAVAQDFSCE